MARVSLLLCLLLGACASFEQRDAPVWPYPEPPGGSHGDDYPEYRPPAGPADEPDPGAADTAPPRSDNSAAVALVSQARSEAAAGNLERAAATLERALRVAPSDPVPWYELARVRFEQSNLVQAENLARRSLSFAGGRADVQRAAWTLIADIKSLQGDPAAERKARHRALEAG